MWRRSSRTRDPLPRRNENHINSAHSSLPRSVITTLVFACETRDRICQSGNSGSGYSPRTRLWRFPREHGSTLIARRGTHHLFNLKPSRISSRIFYVKILLLCVGYTTPLYSVLFSEFREMAFSPSSTALQVTQIIWNKYAAWMHYAINDNINLA